jgi:hypothetical protein
VENTVLEHDRDRLGNVEKMNQDIAADLQKDHLAKMIYRETRMVRDIIKYRLLKTEIPREAPSRNQIDCPLLNMTPIPSMK